MGHLMRGGRRSARAPGNLDAILRELLGAGWSLTVCGGAVIPREHCEGFSRQRDHRNDACLEDAWGFPAYGSECWEHAFFQRWKCLRLPLRPNPVAGLRGQGIEVASAKRICTPWSSCTPHDSLLFSEL